MYIYPGHFNIYFLFNFCWKCSRFIVVFKLLLYSKVIQVYIYILFHFGLSQDINIVPCATE